MAIPTYCIIATVYSQTSQAYHFFCALQIWLVGTTQNGKCIYLDEYFNSYGMFWCFWIGSASSIYLVSGLVGATTRGESDFASMQCYRAEIPWLSDPEVGFIGMSFQPVLLVYSEFVPESHPSWRSLMAYSMLLLWPKGSFEKIYNAFHVSQVIITTPTHQYGILMEGCPAHRWRGTCEMVPQDSSTYVDTEITDGLFNASFLAIRQLWNGLPHLPSLSGHLNHSYSPIWGSDGGLPSTQVARDLWGDAKGTQRSLMAYSMPPFWPYISFEQTYQVS